jgi:Asp-tRNA(Asn)/Glu-tRNA(Gln) amidotransferase A subunit family amidase
MQQMMQNYDVLLTAAAPGEAWGGRQATGDPAFNTAWTALHMPSVSVPAFIGASGLPIGLQLIGRFRHDDALLAATAAIGTELDVSTVGVKD